MRDLTPAWNRIARYEAQAGALRRKIEAEHMRIKLLAKREMDAALKRAGIVPGQTVIGDKNWRMIGLFRGVRVQSSKRPGPRSPNWWIEIHYRSIRSDGRLGQRIGYKGVSVDEPREIATKLTIMEQRML